MDVKLSQAQVPKIIQSGGFIQALLGKLATPLMKVAVSLAKNELAMFFTMTSTSPIYGAIQRKMCGRKAIATSEVGKEKTNHFEGGYG